jgi:non-ribosomal peptide synthetase component F
MGKPGTGPQVPLADGDRSMMFNTGDIVRWHHTGCLETFGRQDDQVKVKVSGFSRRDDHF